MLNSALPERVLTINYLTNIFSSDLTLQKFYNDRSYTHYWVDFETFKQIYKTDKLDSNLRTFLRLWEQDKIRPLPVPSLKQLAKTRHLFLPDDSVELRKIRTFEHIFHPDNVVVYTGKLGDYINLRNQFSSADLLY